MNRAKVLVAIPYHKKKDYALKKVLEAVDNLKHRNIDIEVLMRWDLGVYGGDDNVKKQREFFRQIVLKDKSFTHLYFLGVDTIPPADVLEKLLAHDVDIAGGVYFGRHNADNGTPNGAVAWIHSLNQEQQTKLFLEPDRLCIVNGMGMDCVLFSRAVLEKVSWMDWQQNDDDYPYYDMAMENGFNCYLDTNVQCRHYFNEDGYSYRAEVFKD